MKLQLTNNDVEAPYRGKRSELKGRNRPKRDHRVKVPDVIAEDKTKVPLVKPAPMDRRRSCLSCEPGRKGQDSEPGLKGLEPFILENNNFKTDGQHYFDELFSLKGVIKLIFPLSLTALAVKSTTLKANAETSVTFAKSLLVSSFRSLATAVATVAFLKLSYETAVVIKRAYCSSHLRIEDKLGDSHVSSHRTGLMDSKDYETNLCLLREICPDVELVSVGPDLPTACASDPNVRLFTRVKMHTKYIASFFLDNVCTPESYFGSTRVPKALITDDPTGSLMHKDSKWIYRHNQHGDQSTSPIVTQPGLVKIITPPLLAQGSLYFTLGLITILSFQKYIGKSVSILASLLACLYSVEFERTYIMRSVNVMGTLEYYTLRYVGKSNKDTRLFSLIEPVKVVSETGRVINSLTISKPIHNKSTLSLMMNGDDTSVEFPKEIVHLAKTMQLRPKPENHIAEVLKGINGLKGQKDKHYSVPQIILLLTYMKGQDGLVYAYNSPTLSRTSIAPDMEIVQLKDDKQYPVNVVGILPPGSICLPRQSRMNTEHAIADRMHNQVHNKCPQMHEVREALDTFVSHFEAGLTPALFSDIYESSLGKLRKTITVQGQEQMAFDDYANNNADMRHNNIDIVFSNVTCDVIKEYDMDVRDHCIIDQQVKSFIKVESRNLGLKSQRLITPMNASIRLAALMCAKPMSKWVVKNVDFLAAYRPMSEILKDLALDCTDSKQITTSDFHRMDSTIGKFFRRYLDPMLLKALFGEEHHNFVLQAYHSVYGRTVSAKQGCSYFIGYAQASGDPFTSILNSLRAAFLVYWSLLRSGIGSPDDAWKALNKWKILGDDTIGPTVMDKGIMVETADKLGLKVEVEVVTRPQDDQFEVKHYTSFLGRVGYFWYGCAATIQDPGRMFRSLITNTNPHSILGDDALYFKAYSYLISDYGGPLAPLLVGLIFLSRGVYNINQPLNTPDHVERKKPDGIKLETKVVIRSSLTRNQCLEDPKLLVSSFHYDDYDSRFLMSIRYFYKTEAVMAWESGADLDFMQYVEHFFPTYNLLNDWARAETLELELPVVDVLKIIDSPVQHEVDGFVIEREDGKNHDDLTKPEILGMETKNEFEWKLVSEGSIEPELTKVAPTLLEEVKTNPVAYHVLAPTDNKTIGAPDDNTGNVDSHMPIKAKDESRKQERKQVAHKQENKHSKAVRGQRVADAKSHQASEDINVKSVEKLRSQDRKVSIKKTTTVPDSKKNSGANGVVGSTVRRTSRRKDRQLRERSKLSMEGLGDVSGHDSERNKPSKRIGKWVKQTNPGKTPGIDKAAVVKTDGNTNQKGSEDGKSVATVTSDAKSTNSNRH